MNLLLIHPVQPLSIWFGGRGTCRNPILVEVLLGVRPKYQQHSEHYTCWWVCFVIQSPKGRGEEKIFAKHVETKMGYPTLNNINRWNMKRRKFSNGSIVMAQNGSLKGPKLLSYKLLPLFALISPLSNTLCMLILKILIENNWTFLIL